MIRVESERKEAGIPAILQLCYIIVHHKAKEHHDGIEMRFVRQTQNKILRLL